MKEWPDDDGHHHMNHLAPPPSPIFAPLHSVTLGEAPPMLSAAPPPPFLSESPPLRIMTFNLGLLRLKVMGATIFSSPPFVPNRFDAMLVMLPALLAEKQVDVCALQEIYEPDEILWYEADEPWAR